MKSLANGLYAKQADDIRVYHVGEASSVTDYHLIASGTSGPHLRALAGAMRELLKEMGVPGYRHTGDPESGWMVSDCVDVIIHIMSPEARAYYALDKLWESVPRVGLEFESVG